MTADQTRFSPASRPARLRPDAEPARLRPDAEPARLRPDAEPARLRPDAEPARLRPDAEPARLRLDLALVAQGIAATRSRARDLIVRGLVSVEGQRSEKPALMVATDARLVVAGEDAGLVSRGGVKLKAALQAFGFD